jgi:hypothetical protein
LVHAWAAGPKEVSLASAAASSSEPNPTRGERRRHRADRQVHHVSDVGTRRTVDHGPPSSAGSLLATTLRTAICSASRVADSFNTSSGARERLAAMEDSPVLETGSGTILLVNGGTSVQPKPGFAGASVAFPAASGLGLDRGPHRGEDLATEVVMLETDGSVNLVTGHELRIDPLREGTLVCHAALPWSSLPARNASSGQHRMARMVTRSCRSPAACYQGGGRSIPHPGYRADHPTSNR